jgi:dissimilatory sulfite reductase (desulfoviridin) alpha/beta subunit
MDINVSTNPDVIFYPDFENNLELPESQRFGVVLKKINQELHSHKWVYQNDKGERDLDWRLWAKAHVLRLVNPPGLIIDGKNKRLMTINDIFGDEFLGLVDIAEQINKKIIDMRYEDLDTKK